MGFGSWAGTVVAGRLRRILNQRKGGSSADTGSRMSAAGRRQTERLLPHRAETAPVKGARAVAVETGTVLRRAIAFVPRKSVFRVEAVHGQHHAVTEDLGQDGRCADSRQLPVPADDCLCLRHIGTAAEIRQAVTVDLDDPGPVRQAKDGERIVAPLQKIGVLAASSLRVEPYKQPFKVLPHE